MKYLVVALLLLSAHFGWCQQYKYTYYFDENLRPAAKDGALIVGRGVKTSEGVTVDFFATKTGKKLFTTEFTDSTLNYMNGRNVDYDDKGRPRESNYFKNNILDGVTQKWDAAGRMTDSIIYGRGKMLQKTKFSYTKEGALVQSIFTDSVNNTMTATYFDPSQKKSSEAIFTGNKGVWNKYNETGVFKTDSVFTREERDAAFPGGPKAWRGYLERNLDGSIPVRNRAPLGNYVVIVQFVVDIDGKISDIKALSNNGYGTEDEAIRVIKRSGKWVPATRFGKPIKAYRKQPLTFQVQQRIPNTSSSFPSQRPSGF